MRVAHHRDLALLHRLQQGGLRLRRRPVDLVGEHEVAEQRAFLEDELALAADLLEHGIPGDVAGQEVRGELNAPRFQLHGLGDALDQLGLAQARQSFE